MLGILDTFGKKATPSMVDGWGYALTERKFPYDMLNATTKWFCAYTSEMPTPDKFINRGFELQAESKAKAGGGISKAWWGHDGLYGGDWRQVDKDTLNEVLRCIRTLMRDQTHLQDGLLAVQQAAFSNHLLGLGAVEPVLPPKIEKQSVETVAVIGPASVPLAPVAVIPLPPKADRYDPFQEIADA